MGEITGRSVFSNITKKDFKKGAKLRKYSSTESGFTEYGFMDFLLDKKHISKNDFERVIDKMGYDKDLFSTKSRSFIVSILSDKPVDVKPGNAIEVDF